MWTLNINEEKKLLTLKLFDTLTLNELSLFIPQKYITGFSYLYKSMLSDDLFKIEILESLDTCAEYLSVDKKLLEDAVK